MNKYARSQMLPLSYKHAIVAICVKRAIRKSFRLFGMKLRLWVVILYLQTYHKRKGFFSKGKFHSHVFINSLRIDLAFLNK